LWVFFSPRPGTPGADLTDQVPEEVKTERLARLQALVAEQQQAFNRSCVGRVLPVLLERKGRIEGQLGGRSPYLQAVHLDAPAELFGTIQPVLITGLGNNSLSGKIVMGMERNSASLVESEPLWSNRV
jgi:tRNA-2-methylthio-N6-dimethylallyladenosine synthase